jgi:hypothetical protein
MDMLKNGTETDLNCGGDVCQPCANGLTCLVAADCESGSCIEGKCSACQLGANLVLNGGGEDGPGGISHDDVVDIPSWVRTGNLIPLKWGVQAGYPGAGTAGPVDRGLNVFIGGAGATSNITQDIDVSACAEYITAGKVQMELSGWLGGLDSDPDFAEFIATFKDDTGAPKGTPQIGPVTAADRGGVLALLERTTTVDVPIETRTISVMLKTTRNLGSYCNGYADNLSLMLSLK